MKRFVKRVFAVGCSALCACVAVGQKPVSVTTDAVGTVTVKTPVATRKIMLDEDISSLESGAVKVSGAKGESESGQFIVRCDENISSYDVSISDFKAGQSTISAENVEICKQVYTYCTDNIAYDGTLGAGWYPDALIPLQYIKNKGEDVVKAGENQGFWLTVKIPETAEADTYSATVTFTYNETGKITVPVTLTVYDFTLQSTPTFISRFGLYDEWLQYGELTNSIEKYMQYHDFLLDYNVTTTPHETLSADEFVEYVREYYDRITVLQLPYKSLDTATNDWNYMKVRMTALLQACIDDGVNYFDKAMYRMSMFYDEYDTVTWRDPLVKPTIERTDELEEEIIAEFVGKGLLDNNGEIANTIRGIRHHMTAWWDEKYGDLLNLSCPLYPNFWYTEGLEEAERLREEKDVIWWSYGCIMSDFYPSPTWEIDDYLISIRDMLWFNYENDIMGNLLWSVNGYCDWDTPAVNSAWSWKLIQNFYTNASHEGMTNGDGYLLYPGRPYGSEYPFASLRLAVYRDAVDDHTYMSQLGQRYAELAETYGDGYAVSDAKALVAFFNDQLLGRNASKLHYDEIFSARDQLATAMEMANASGFVVEKLQTNIDKIEYSFYANAGETVTLGGKVLSGTAFGNGVKYIGSIDISENRELKLSVGDKTMTLLTAPKTFLLVDFDTETDVSNFAWAPYSKDIKDWNTDEDFSVSGGSLKFTLLGRNDKTGLKTYRPSFGINMQKFNVEAKDILSIEFDIYNPNNEAFTIDVGFKGTESCVYDKMTLRPHEWRTIKMDNFNVFTRDVSNLKNYFNYIRIALDKNLLTDTLNAQGVPEVRQATFYLDNLIVRKK